MIGRLRPDFVVLHVFEGRRDEPVPDIASGAASGGLRGVQVFHYTLLGLGADAGPSWRVLQGRLDQLIEALKFPLPAGLQTCYGWPSRRVRGQIPLWRRATWLPDEHVEAPTAGSVSSRRAAEIGWRYGFMSFSCRCSRKASDFFAPLVNAQHSRLSTPRWSPWPGGMKKLIAIRRSRIGVRGDRHITRTRRGRKAAVPERATACLRAPVPLRRVIWTACTRARSPVWRAGGAHAKYASSSWSSCWPRSASRHPASSRVLVRSAPSPPTLGRLRRDVRNHPGATTCSTFTAA